MNLQARAEAMQRWVDEEEMAALAVFGMEEDQLNHLCARVDPEGIMSRIAVEIVSWIPNGLSKSLSVN